MERRRSPRPNTVTTVVSTTVTTTVGSASGSAVNAGTEPAEVATRPPAPTAALRTKRGVPEGLWQKCEGCSRTIYRKEAEEIQNVCPQCGFHWYVSAAQRIAQLLDAGTFEECDASLRPTDPLGFRDKKAYAERIVAEQKRTGMRDAVVTGTGMIRARRVACGVTDSSFIMGSMGSVVGERLTRLVERATAGKLPLIVISASGGGARMHEGILSLMQMAKVSAALARHSQRLIVRSCRSALLTWFIRWHQCWPSRPHTTSPH
jgi:acetyl-CoA carboxylase carboxyl transferase subunit beta